MILEKVKYIYDIKIIIGLQLYGTKILIDIWDEYKTILMEVISED